MANKKDVLEVLDEQIAEFEKIASDAVTMTNRRQARIKADVLKEFRDLIA